MKRILFYIFFLIFTITCYSGNSDKVSLGYFYDKLTPYGQWIELSDGIVGWIPQVSREWMPYSDGYWEYTDYGWFWMSYEEFGDVVYHYGRWYNDSWYGWIWIPDYEWGPSWVEWRYNDMYIGWAPLSPYVQWNMYGLVFLIDFSFSYDMWNFVLCDHFHYRHIRDHFVHRNDRRRIHDQTISNHVYRYRNGRPINEGIDPRELERSSTYRYSERKLVIRDGEDVNIRGDRTDIEIDTPTRERLEINRGDRKLNRINLDKPIDSEKINRNEIINENDVNKRKPDVKDRTVEKNRETNLEKQVPERKKPVEDVNKKPETQDRQIPERKKNIDENKQRPNLNDQKQVERKNPVDERKVIPRNENRVPEKRVEPERKKSPEIRREKKTNSRSV